MDGSITVLGRLEGQTIFDRTEIRLPPEGVDQTAMLRLAEQVSLHWCTQHLHRWVQGFGLPKGSVTAVLWDDDTDRGLLIRRDKEFSRLRDGDELCFRWNKPLRMDQQDKPWFVVQEESFPSMRNIEVTLNPLDKCRCRDETMGTSGS